MTQMIVLHKTNFKKKPHRRALQVIRFPFQINFKAFPSPLNRLVTLRVAGVRPAAESTPAMFAIYAEGLVEHTIATKHPFIFAFGLVYVPGLHTGNSVLK